MTMCLLCLVAQEDLDKAQLWLARSCDWWNRRILGGAILLEPTISCTGATGSETLTTVMVEVCRIVGGGIRP